MTDSDLIRLDFPLHAALIGDDRVVILIPRYKLPELRAFLHALELGLDAGITAVGHG